METKNTLIPKLAKILGEMARLKKTGHNDFHNYDYATEADTLDAVRSKLAEAGVFVFTSQESVETREIERVKGNDRKTAVCTRVQLKHTFSDGESSFEVFSYGESEDTGDKGLYKAVTGAMKYFVAKNFMISTGNDPETTSAESHGDRKAPVKMQSAAGTFEDTILSHREKSGMSKANKPYTCHYFMTAEHGELQTVYDDVAKRAKGYVGTGETLIIVTEQSNPKYAPSLKSVTIKEFESTAH